MDDILSVPHVHLKSMRRFQYIFCKACFTRLFFCFGRGLWRHNAVHRLTPLTFTCGRDCETPDIYGAVPLGLLKAVKGMGFLLVGNQKSDMFGYRTREVGVQDLSPNADVVVVFALFKD